MSNLDNRRARRNRPQIECGDIVIEDYGYLGSQYFVGEYLGKKLGVFNTRSQVCHAIRDYCDKFEYWPNIFYINDHGNVMQVKLVFKSEGGAS